MELFYSIQSSRFGVVLAAGNENGVCFIGLWDDMNYLIKDLQTRFPETVCHQDDNSLKTTMDSLRDYLDGQKNELKVKINLIGTPFQKKVWLALREVPYGHTLTYTQLTEKMGLGSSSVRAVAHGCATNPVSLVVPCHRILRSDGSLGGYYWGLERKQALLEMEGAVSKSARQIPLL